MATLPTGIVVDWNAADLATGAVSSWASTGSMPVTVAQTDTNFQPSNVGNSINGLPAVDSDGVDDRLYVGSTNMARNVDGFSVYTVVRADSAAAGTRQIVSISSGASAGAARFSFRTVDGNLGIAGRRLDADSFQLVTGTTTIADGAWHAATVIANYGAGTASSYVDGTVGVNAAAFQTAGFTSDTASASTVLGGHGNNTIAEMFDGATARVIIYNTVHTDADRAQVHSYIQDTYGITVSDYVGTLQEIAPIADITAGGWTGSYTTLADEDDLTYIEATAS